mmetsp:Transcript_3641/g.11434  ORF Transcript_3641/g.11434 Transcript_3641/m.11434 type:complete len:511 (-) Transcript_3641:82-1614(-)
MHHPPSASHGTTGGRSTGRRGLRLLLVCLVFGIGFLCGAVAMWARPQATRPGNAVRGAVRHHHEHVAGQPHGFVKPVGIDDADHEGLRVARPVDSTAGHVSGHDDRDQHHDGNDGHEHHEEVNHDDDHHPRDADDHHIDHVADHHAAHHEDDATTDAALKAKLLKEVPEDSIEATAIRRSAGGTLFVIPVNDGYIDFGLNLLCSMQRLALFSGVDAAHRDVGGGYLFVAMDELAYDKLRQIELPVVKDPDVPFVSSKSAAWGDPKFHQLVCTKLIPVLRFLKAGLNVILSDADIVFRHDPFPFVRRDLGMTFTIGSCHKDLPDNFNLASNDGLAKLNTGFYHAVSSPGVISLLSRALQNCKTSHLTGDQPAINTVLHEDQNKGLPGYTYGFFDGCLFANGCIYFKHLCANTTMPDPRPSIAAGKGSATALKKVASHKLKGASDPVPEGHIRRDDPVMVHANFLVGKKDKIKHLRRYDLWAEQCIAQWRGNVTDAPKSAAAEGSKGAGPHS